MTTTDAPIDHRPISIMDPRRHDRNRKRLRKWIASIDYRDKPEFSFDFDEDTAQIVIHHRVPSAHHNGDTVSLNVRYDMPLNVPSAWPWVLLEAVLLIERHEIYERLFVGNKRVYEPHDRSLNFNDDPPVRMEVLDDFDEETDRVVAAWRTPR